MYKRMTQNEYERTKARLGEQRRSAIEMVEAGYQAQIRALELYWTLQTGKGEVAQPTAVDSAGPAVAPPSGQEAQPLVEAAPRRNAPGVDADVRAAFTLLPETFTRHDACRVLGYEPYRGALYLSLQKLVREGLARVVEPGAGHRAVVYQKTGAGNPPRSG
jgi:hypothetical protein